ncbi:MAG: enoyl-[acyl-carrier-protein] reductase FabI [Magnetococcales bacterium]|nr:enoyl-[acyl-carrier-protein] reductase FabI [Magnetococcales bacterium]MEC8066779.1 enoyl-ACP reductase [Pseudomonadota bacterium]|tara:strand:+ start:2519 stop:3301 length:783 start_codon:yes stop_codon:yes gene_type:complete
MNLMQGKKGIVMGVANKNSIAWGIAQSLHEAGAEIGFTYVGEALERRVKPLAESIGSDFVIECDVTNDDAIEETFKQVKEKWGEIDFIVHAIAFSNKEELKGRYIETSRDNFKLSLDVSCYSLTAVCKAAEPLLKEGASVITLSYYGAEKIVPNYNVMGVAKAALEASVRYLADDLGSTKQVRVNSISAGPIKTLAASGIGGFKSILDANENNAPLRRNVTQEEVGKTALYLLSDLSTGVTGENLHVDAGASQVGIHLNK